MKICVTGIGVVSALGIGYKAQLNALRNGKTGIKKSEFLNSKYADLMPFGALNMADEDLDNLISVEDTYGFTRTDYLAFLAFEEAVKSSELNPEELQNFRTSIVSATSVGGMSKTDELYADANSLTESSEFVASFGAGVHTLHLAQHFGIKGYTDTINTACSSSTNAIMIGAKMIANGWADRVIVGGADGMAKFTVNGFNSLQILSNKQCQPFDEDRVGLNLGEGAAYLVLEAEHIAKGKKIFAEVIGYGNANDSYHPSSLSDDAIGVTKAMQKALDKAGIQASEIDYINAHGTGTKNNDFVEYEGFKKVFGDNIPPYHSTKSYTGHTLAAAGAIEAVFTLLSMVNSELYASLQLKKPMATIEKMPIMDFQKNVSIQYAMSNSFGFAGNCSSVIFSKVE